MTFNKSRVNNLNYSLNSINSVSVEDEEAKRCLNNLQQLFIDFEKSYEVLKDYNKRLPSLTEREYIKRSHEIHGVISSIKQFLYDINYNLTKLESFSISDYNLKNNVFESIKIVNKKIKPKQDELSNIINEITKKEEKKNESLGVSLASRKTMQIDLRKKSYENSNDNNYQLKEQLINVDLEIKDIEFTEQILAQRNQELKDIQKVSAQVKDMTFHLQTSVQEQGEKLSKIIKIIIFRFS